MSREDRFYKYFPDQRTAFQRDRDRVLYAPEFRRLAGVTQVVHVEEGHIFHNRLTHSLKVAQIARRMAENLQHKTDPDILEAAGGLSPDVVETAALAHDIGHPPFGHIAEEELDNLLRKAGVPDGYEGNAQSFRIVTQLSIRANDNPGLNLSRASLNAILKYPWQRATSGAESKKWGFYYSEENASKFARGMEEPADKRKSLEAELMDLADDITYSVHDVEDFYRAGFIPLDRLLLGLSERDRFLDRVYTRWEKDGVLGPSKDIANKFFNELATLFSELKEPFHGNAAQRGALHSFSTLLIRRYVLGPNQAPITVSPKNERRLEIDTKVRNEITLLKELMRNYVFSNPALLGQQHGQRRIIKDLFEMITNSLKAQKNGADLLPQPFQDYLVIWGLDTAEKKCRLAADFIASLTEQQALSLHRRLTGQSPGSVRELIVR